MRECRPLLVFGPQLLFNLHSSSLSSYLFSLFTARWCMYLLTSTTAVYDGGCGELCCVLCGSSRLLPLSFSCVYVWCVSDLAFSFSVSKGLGVGVRCTCMHCVSCDAACVLSVECNTVLCVCVGVVVCAGSVGCL